MSPLTAVLMALALCVASHAYAQDAPVAGVPAQVTTLPEGTLILRSFDNAPYPHASRQDGYRIGDLTFPPESYRDSTVALFIPKGFHPAKATDFVVHFHGHYNNVRQVLTQFDLPGEMSKSGRNAILVVPQGPKDAQDSGGGHLERDPGAFASLMREVADYLATTGRISSPSIGHIVVTAHSGGYKVTSAILATGGMDDHITDVLLFDASYGNLEGFADWAKGGKVAGHARRLVSLFTPHLASANVELMGLLDARRVRYRVTMDSDLDDATLAHRSVLFVHTTTLEHNDVIAKRDDYARFLRLSALALTP